MGSEGKAEKVAVLRALPGLGDLLCAVPALERLRAAMPNAHVALIGLASAREFVTRYTALIDELISIPGFPGLPEQPVDPAAVTTFLTTMQARRFDLAIQMHGSGGVTNVVTALLGAKLNAGYHVAGSWHPTGAFIPYPCALPEPSRWTALADHMSLPEVDHGIGFPIVEAERHAIATLQPVGRYAIVHPGASEPERRWPADRFAVVADALAKQGYRVVLSGTTAEAPITAAVANAMCAPSLDLAGRTSLGTLAALVEGAALLVTNDTGVSHLAVAVGTPSVVLFLASDRARWAPLDADRHRCVGSGLPDASLCRTAPPPPEVADVLAQMETLEPSLAA